MYYNYINDFTWIEILILFPSSLISSNFEHEIKNIQFKVSYNAGSFLPQTNQFASDNTFILIRGSFHFLITMYHALHLKEFAKLLSAE